MALNFDSYLLSSSPPGFDYNHFFKRDIIIGRSSCNGYTSSRFDAEAKESEEGLYVQENGLIVNRQKPAERIKKWEKSYSCGNLPRLNSCLRTSGLGSKKVSFADDIGLALEDIRELTEAFDVPPEFSNDLLTKLGLDVPIFSVEQLTFAFNFAQPSADYLEFREKLDRNKVCLEKVIAKDRKLVGSARVKNISYEKNVTVRCSFDEWKSFVDFKTSYIVANDASSEIYPFDTFSFEIAVPSGLSEDSKFYFAICYEADNQQFWDNNSGENYEVVCLASDTDLSSERITFSAKRSDSWTDFASWNGVDSSPYW